MPIIRLSAVALLVKKNIAAAATRTATTAAIIMPTFAPDFFLIGVATTAAAPISPNGLSFALPKGDAGVTGDSGINAGAGAAEE